jgi:hypothetical protein
VTADATVERSVKARLGGGDNSLTHDGVINGNLFVTSANEDDTVTVADTATVGGETILTLGEQPEFDGHHRFGRGPFGGGRGFGAGMGMFARAFGFGSRSRG